ncbi:MAG: radical SAM protein [Candidatus Ancaeobacter aquaticus]|nr:radical SAM protein [Candidatus Ancaeobacter aquaticus]
MNNKKIVLFHPNPFSATRPYYGAPLGVLAISRLLYKEGYDIKVVHPITHKQFKQVVVEECKDAICLGISSITGYQIFEGRDVAKAVKERYPNLPIIWGGWHPSILPLETIKDETVDIVVKGQGEWTFPELVKCIENNGDKKDILGIVYKENGNVIENSERPIQNLNDLPPIPYDLISDIEKFIVKQEYGNRSLNYYTSMGCPHRCGFCVEEIVTKRKWVSLSADNIVAELEEMKEKYNIDSVAIIDSNFFTDRDRVKKMCELMIERKVNMIWGNVNGRTTTLTKYYDDDLWALMKLSGLGCVLTGAESADQETLDYMNKDINADDVLKLAQYCNKYDIKLLCSYLVGFPWSKDPLICQRKVQDEITVSLVQIKKLFRIFSRIRFMFALYLPYPSTTLFDASKSLGIEIPTSFAGWSNFLIAAEDATKLKVRQTWINKKQARLVLILSTYFFFFLDPDSYDLVGNKIKSKIYKLVYFIGFYLFKFIVLLRWKLNFYTFPFDFYIYNFLRKYSGLG